MVALMVGPTANAAPANTELWVQRYNGSGHAADLANSVAVSPDGSKVFVTGLKGGSGTNGNYATIAYDTGTGQILWGKGYKGPGDSFDAASSVAVSPDGTIVFVTGGSVGSGTSYDYATIAYDAASGQVLWGKRYGGPGPDGAGSVAVSPDGSKVFVTGGSWGSSIFYDYATIAYDATTGQVAWVKRYDGPGNGDDLATSLAVSPDGSIVFVTGESLGSRGVLDYATIAYDAATGQVLWGRRYASGNGSSMATSLAVSPDGSRIFVTGESWGWGKDNDYATIAYDATTGQVVWWKRYKGPGNAEDVAYSVAVSPDGSNVFVTGATHTSWRSNAVDYGTIGYAAATGQVLWEKLYNGPGDSFDAASSVAVSPDGSMIFVTGSSDGSGTYSDYATIAYDATTAEVRWGKRYNGPGNFDDGASAIAVSPDGSMVFVTGGDYASDTGEDYATIAYSTT